MLECGEAGENLVNSYALVTYIPEPLRVFLDDLRLGLAPDCFPQAHVTILPPRSLKVSPAAAWEQARSVVERFPSFEIVPLEVEVFEARPVVYIAVGAGRAELIRLHELLNVGALECEEPFPYHPHITVAQELTRDRVEELARCARRKWAGCPHEAPFRVESVTFVRATVDNRWIDLFGCDLAPGA
jgi:2'-5' RNA ligase